MKLPKDLMMGILDDISMSSFGRKRSVCLVESKCVMCGFPAQSFTTEDNKLFYEMAAMCQDCQDEMEGVERTAH